MEIASQGKGVIAVIVIINKIAAHIIHYAQIIFAL
jgi:hypothetical protein